MSAHMSARQGTRRLGMLSLPQDCENAQKHLRGAQAAFEEEGCDPPDQGPSPFARWSTRQTTLLTAHLDITAICGIYDEVATGAAKVLQTRNLSEGRGGHRDRSPTTVKMLREGVIQGIFLQDAGGQGIEATQQVYNALTGKATTKEMPLTEPLVTAGHRQSRSTGEAQAQRTTRSQRKPRTP